MHVSVTAGCSHAPCRPPPRQARLRLLLGRGAGTTPQGSQTLSGPAGSAMHDACIHDGPTVRRGFYTAPTIPSAMISWEAPGERGGGSLQKIIRIGLSDRRRKTCAAASISRRAARVRRTDDARPRHLGDDSCNFRCNYCMPREVFPTPATTSCRTTRSSASRMRIARLGAGYRPPRRWKIKDRLTGGEPLGGARHRLDGGCLKAWKVEITLTTNAAAADRRREEARASRG